jgi:hypothetical protein
MPAARNSAALRRLSSPWRSASELRLARVRVRVRARVGVGVRVRARG